MTQSNVENTPPAPKKRSKLIRNLPILIIVALVGGPAGLNYSGFCMSKGGWLSNEERIRISIASINNRRTIPIYVKGDTTYGIRNPQYVRYDSVDAFLESNPNCCNVSDWQYGGSHEFSPPSFLDRILGRRFSGVVDVSFAARYIDENGNQVTSNMKFPSIQTNCGKNPLK